MAKDFASEVLADALNSAIDKLAPMGTGTRGFLEGRIYPTLVPALEALLKEVERCKTNGLEEPVPLDWLASDLMRHNPAAVPVPVPTESD
jgi:hypothetical protein